MTPRLDHAARFEIAIGPALSMGECALGERRLIPILGGRVMGPRLRGEVLPGYDILSWAALFGRARLPEPVVRTLAGLVRERWPGSDLALRARFAEIGFVPAHSTPAELAEPVKHDIPRWGEAIRRAGLQPK